MKYECKYCQSVYFSDSIMRDWHESGQCEEMLDRIHAGHGVDTYNLMWDPAQYGSVDLLCWRDKTRCCPDDAACCNNDAAHPNKETE